MSRSRKRKKQRTIPVHGPRHEPEQGDQQQPSADAEQDSGRRSWLAPVTAVVLVLAAGVAYGLQTHRWTKSKELDEAADKLQQVPSTIGEWEGRDIEIPEMQLKIAGATGYLHRVYRHRKSGKEVTVLVLCGPHGPISVHPPTVCFVSAGWNLETEPAPRAVKLPDAESPLGHFWVTRFRKVSSTSVGRMRTCWAWNGTGGWEASERPRFEFAGADHLFKIYVSEELSPNPKQEPDPEFDQGACVEFMRDFLPALKAAGI